MPTQTDVQDGRDHGAVRLSGGNFDYFGQIAAVLAGWGLEFRQLDAGPSPTRMVQIAADGVLLESLALSRSYQQSGASPVGMRTFGLVAPTVQDVRWCGQRPSEQHLCQFSTAGDFEATSRPGFRCWTISISDVLLADAAARLSGRAWPPDRPAGEVVTIGAARAAALRREIDRLSARLRAGVGARERRALAEELRTEFPMRLVDAITSSAAAPPRPPLRTRELAFERAVSLLRDRTSESVSVRELCELTDVSWRTLDYAFREFAGVSPKKYMKAISLDRVREQLRRREPGTRIADVANRFGFWHMGQFARDYRAQFGELPSETLLDARRDAARSVSRTLRAR